MELEQLKLEVVNSNCPLSVTVQRTCLIVNEFGVGYFLYYRGHFIRENNISNAAF